MTEQEFGFRPDEAITKRREEKEARKQEHTQKAAENEAEMDKQPMPPWALVLYYQNKAIMAELGIE